MVKYVWLKQTQRIKNCDVNFLCKQFCEELKTAAENEPMQNCYHVNKRHIAQVKPPLSWFHSHTHTLMHTQWRRAQWQFISVGTRSFSASPICLLQRW